MLSFLECLVQGHLAQFAAHRRLSQLRHGEERIRDAVRRDKGLDASNVEDSVDLNRHVVASNGLLRLNWNRFFLEGMNVCHAIDKRNGEVKTRREDALEFAEALDDVGQLLGQGGNVVPDSIRPID